jgi:hypothetical protein
VDRLWQFLDALDGWISKRMGSLWQWFLARSTPVRVLFMLPMGSVMALFSPVLLIVAGLFLPVRLLMLLGRWSRGQSLENWKYVAACCVIVAVPFWQMSMILYSPKGELTS